MPNIHIVCIGKLKEKYWKDAEAEYAKRLTSFCRLVITEKKEVFVPKDASTAAIEKARSEESRQLRQASRGALIALSPDGDKITSEEFASMIKGASAKDITFAVGGSYGLSESFKKSAGKTISFSDLTMPHQLFRIVLLEQIYRAFMISCARTYHK
ncbi:MAG: 23S rRNA (pseudouridine(1915)-N(3))-methyltransferase RlmH [Christensenellales bacterium]|jgi:23S rRNA (pseudouridine1915-N3)-methyltransferase